jgi:hypothetical protein
LRRNTRAKWKITYLGLREWWWRFRWPILVAEEEEVEVVVASTTYACFVVLLD